MISLAEGEEMWHCESAVKKTPHILTVLQLYPSFATSLLSNGLASCKYPSIRCIRIRIFSDLDILLIYNKYVEFRFIADNRVRRRVLLVDII
jgi:hypothetical protein